ncbi:MAG: hypothetical protein HY602_01195 [Parcubacteria group bacterium]|nr:hypothetical protein [Parcubacteria group bacterium]
MDIEKTLQAYESLFNEASSQKEEMLRLYEKCKSKNLDPKKKEDLETKIQIIAEKVFGSGDNTMRQKYHQLFEEIMSR